MGFSKESPHKQSACEKNKGKTNMSLPISVGKMHHTNQGKSERDGKRFVTLCLFGVCS